MGKRWSKLQTKLYSIIDPDINFQIHIALYEMNSNDGYHTSKLPRYFITIDKEIVFDYPKQFDTKMGYNVNVYPYITEISDISNIIEEYINTPIDKIMNNFENDKWGITDIIRVCDRRIGKRRLEKIYEKETNEIIKKIIKLRFKKDK